MYERKPGSDEKMGILNDGRGIEPFTCNKSEALKYKGDISHRIVCYVKVYSYFYHIKY